MVIYTPCRPNDRPKNLEPQEGGSREQRTGASPLQRTMISYGIGGKVTIDTLLLGPAGVATEVEPPPHKSAPMEVSTKKPPSQEKRREDA